MRYINKHIDINKHIASYSHQSLRLLLALFCALVLMFSSCRSLSQGLAYDVDDVYFIPEIKAYHIDTPEFNKHAKEFVFEEPTTPNSTP